MADINKEHSNSQVNPKREAEIIEAFKDSDYQKWELKAKEYMKNPSKMNGLISDAVTKIEINKNGPLAVLWEKIYLLVSLVKDWFKGEYLNISKKSLILIITGLIYFVSPIDIIPDFIAGLGLFDDAAILGFIINQLNKELQAYKSWKENININNHE
jgi:uncharacterized membrane protein YkvA (DUF1232 family)